MTTPSRPNRLPGLALAYPLSLGVFDKYEDAQRAVDTLSDQGFPVQNVLIVGTELKQRGRAADSCATRREPSCRTSL